MARCDEARPRETVTTATAAPDTVAMRGRARRGGVGPCGHRPALAAVEAPTSRALQEEAAPSLDGKSGLGAEARRGGRLGQGGNVRAALPHASGSRVPASWVVGRIFHSPAALVVGRPRTDGRWSRGPGAGGRGGSRVEGPEAPGGAPALSADVRFDGRLGVWKGPAVEGRSERTPRLLAGPGAPAPGTSWTTLPVPVPCPAPRSGLWGTP